ncbi:hypothetical protein OG21DRAFT_521946 [Imleria badia]|nr:hypothetical protein OG21DRAFT_521946 [Imleria badia]
MLTTSIQSPRAAATTQIVTLPPIPELFDLNFLDTLVPATKDAPMPEAEATEVPSNDMMDVLESTAHQKFTTNNAPTFSSTLVPTLDAYLGLRTGIAEDDVDRYLKNAWVQDPNLTLRIIWSTRSIHDGNGEKELFYQAFGWLFENHPRTAITNLHCLVDSVCFRSDKKKKGASHGYWKDLLDILALATVDELRPKEPLDSRSSFLHNYCDRESRPAFKNNQEQEEWSRAQRVERSRRAHDRLMKKLLDNHYRALYVAVSRLFAGQLAKDSDVMDKVAALPADADKNDRIALMQTLTLASKWAPTPGCSHDRVTNISSAICLLLHEAPVSFPIAHKISFSAATSLPASDMHLLRCAYQKHILTRGRGCTYIPEPLMSSKRWSEITYSRIPSICMNNNKERFFTHDEGRFLKYLEDVESGKKQISGVTLLPHVLAIQATEIYRQQLPPDEGTSPLDYAMHERRRPLAEAQMRVVDAQWATLLARLRESGQLDNCIAVCDVSGSMGDIEYTSKGRSPFDVYPIWPSISLSLLVARLAKPPFNDSFITFSASPEFVTIAPESRRVSLGATIDGMSKANYNRNTNFNAVFLKLILPLAIEHKVPNDQMIKRIFVFTDMQFDEANPGEAGNEEADDEEADTEEVEAAIEVDGEEVDDAQDSSSLDPAAEWKTNHDVIAEAYAQAGYDVPELVYWNLWDPNDEAGFTAPVTGERKGVALLSGYSPSLLKVFMGVEAEEGWEVLDKDGQSQPRPSLTPEEWMRKALGRKSYDGLVVVD